jgi:hypothetical protein
MLRRVGCAFAAANFQFVPVRIFEEHSVVAGAVIDAKLGTFHIFPTRFPDDFSHFIDGGAALRPERDPICVGLVIVLFLKRKKFDRRFPSGLKLAIFLVAFVGLETDYGQDLRVEPLGDFTILDPEINVIKKAFAHA